ncbi:MAG: PHP domain-containing protein [Burkholderiales bacterium]
MPQVDLHSHSTISDGMLSPTELVKHAHKQGVNILALTDHDDVAGLAEARTACVAAGVTLINGTEISVTWNSHTLHLLGLRIDPDNDDLQRGLDALREGRRERATRIAAQLEKAGVKNSLVGAECYANRLRTDTSCHGIVSRTHFARFIVGNGYARDAAAAFQKYLAKGKPGYVTHRWATLGEAVGWITGSGGSAVIAHPGRYELDAVQMDSLLAEFKQAGGAGLEVITANHDARQASRFARYADRFGLLASCGSDYHGPGYVEMGRLPALPKACIPVWHGWPEMA